MSQNVACVQLPGRSIQAPFTSRKLACGRAKPRFGQQRQMRCGGGGGQVQGEAEHGMYASWHAVCEHVWCRGRASAQANQATHSSLDMHWIGSAALLDLVGPAASAPSRLGASPASYGRRATCLSRPRGLPEPCAFPGKPGQVASSPSLITYSRSEAGLLEGLSDACLDVRQRALRGISGVQGVEFRV